MVKRAKLGFKNLIVKRGYSEKVADGLWKWYDSRINYLEMYPANCMKQAAAYYSLIPEKDQDIQNEG